MLHELLQPQARELITLGVLVGDVGLTPPRSLTHDGSVDDWDLRRVPNYDPTRTVDAVDAGELTRERFLDELVPRNRPCLVKGACAAWPARTRWMDPEYVIDALGDVEVLVRTTPKIEAFGLRSMASDRDALEACAASRVALPLREALRRIGAPGGDMCFFEMFAGGAMDKLEADVEIARGQRFAFFAELPAPFPGYPRWGAMFYRDSYSDWHFHGNTEAIMCQVVGDKEVLLLPPDEASWASLVPVHQRELKTYAVDGDRYPRFSEIQPLRAIVEAGDGLLIPVNWWHAVQSRTGTMGITVPSWWVSNVADSAQPGTRLTQSREWQRRMQIGELFKRGTSGGV